MAVKIIKGKQVTVWLGTILVGCADSVSLSVSVGEDKTNCRAASATGSRVNTFTPGNIDITGSVSGITRQASGTDAATNVTAENILDGTLAGTVFDFRFNVGEGTDSVRYSAKGFFTKADITGGQDGDGKFSSSSRIIEDLVKTVQA